MLRSPPFEVALRLESYRSASEDRAVVVEVRAGEWVLAVADGVGGQPGGGVTAALAIETVEVEATKLTRSRMRRWPWGYVDNGSKLTRSRGRLWPGFFRALDDALLAHPEAGQTTLVALALTPTGLYGASVGDSEAWLVTADGHFELTEAQQRKSYLGSGRAEPVGFSLPRTLAGRLVVATDGLFKYTDPLALTEAVRHAASIEEAADALVRLASAPAGRFYDDLALIVVQVDTIAPWKRFLSRSKAG